MDPATVLSHVWQWQTCAVYCGASADFASLKNNGSVTSTDGDDITVQLPPATGQEYHCIVSGSTGDVSTLFRFRAMEEKFGKLCVSLMCTLYCCPPCRMYSGQFVGD